MVREMDDVFVFFHAAHPLNCLYCIFKLVKVEVVIVIEHHNRLVRQVIDCSDVLSNRNKSAVLILNEERQRFFQSLLFGVAD